MDERHKHAELLCGPLFDEVSEIPFLHDPMGIDFEDNTGEYEPETATILPRLETASACEEALKVIHQELAH